MRTLEWLLAVLLVYRFCYRRTVLFTTRTAFLIELRPFVGLRGTTRATYPDAWLHIRLKDYFRAREAALTCGHQIVREAGER